MDKHHHDHHDNGFFSGFLLGAIIGAAVVFFLFTDKGKKMLKTITEEGLEGFADFRDLIDEEMDEEDEIYEDMAETERLAPIPHKTEHPKGTSFAEAAYSHVEPIHEHHDHEDHHHEHPEEHIHHDNHTHYETSPSPVKVKRFFRGIKRG